MQDKFSDTIVTEAEGEREREFRKVPPSPKRTPPGEILVVILTVLALLFTLILIVTVTLINTEVTPPPDVTVDPGSSGERPVTEYPVVTIEDNRPRPAIPSYANAPESKTEYVPSLSAVQPITDITSNSAILVDMSNGGSAVYAKSPTEKVGIASLTKVMTLVIACDLIGSPDDFYRVVEIKYSDRLKGYSTAFLDENKYKSAKVYIVDMLYGLVLRSGADCAYGLAEALSGSEEAFVVKMNEKAEAIGMKNTCFTNCVGKDDGGKNYSTAADMATLFTYLLRNEFCREVVGCEKWECVGRYSWLIGNAFKSLVFDSMAKRRDALDAAGVKFLGGKSGNETEARYCLVSFASGRSGKTYICVTTGHRSSSYEDTATILSNYAK